MACRPGAAPGLGGFGDLPVLAGTRHNCGLKWCGQPAPAEGSKSTSISKGNRVRLLPCAAPPASQHWQCRVVASGPWPLEIERSAEPGYPAPSTPLVTVLRREQTLRLAAIRRTAIHNKERTPLRALVSRTRRYFTADVSVFQAHLPCDRLPIFSYRTKA